MAYIPVTFPAEKKGLYALLLEQLKLYVDKEEDQIATLCNASAVLNDALEAVNWIGFYRVSGEELVLGPFQGRAAVSHIAPGKGMCGKAVELKETQVAADVHCYDGYIACDAETRSEIVVPLMSAEGKVLGVLDIDSPVSNRFDADDKAGLESIAAYLVEKLTK